MTPIDQPRTTYFYATGHCNSDCSYCTFRKSNSIQRLSVYVPTIEEILSDEDSLLLNTHFVLQGGEYTQHPEFEKLTAIIKERVQKVSLLTNCINLNAVKAIDFMVDHVTISYDGPAHDRIRGAPGNEVSIKEYLESLSDEQLEKTTLQMTLGPWNLGVEAVKSFLNTCDRYKVEPRFNVAEPTGLLGRGSYGIKLGPNVDQILYEVNLRLGEESIQARYLDLALRRTNRPLCFSTSMYTTIMPNLDVLFCQGLIAGAKIGNLAKESFNDIWTKSKKQRIKYRSCKQCYLSCNLIGDIKFQIKYGRL